MIMIVTMSRAHTGRLSKGSGYRKISAANNEPEHSDGYKKDGKKDRTMALISNIIRVSSCLILPVVDRNWFLP